MDCNARSRNFSYIQRECKFKLVIETVNLLSTCLQLMKVPVSSSKGQMTTNLIQRKQMFILFFPPTPKQLTEIKDMFLFSPKVLSMLYKSYAPWKITTHRLVWKWIIFGSQHAPVAMPTLPTHGELVKGRRPSQ